MDWIGWVAAVGAIGVAVWLWRQLKAERAHASELLCARLDAENALEALRAEHDEQTGAHSALATVASRIGAPLHTARAHLQGIGSQLADYRERVRQFDAAVQYCLQPVELIFGADKATLDQLVGHVEGARRKLFEARAVLVQCPLHRDAAALERGLEDLDLLAEHARGLPAPAAVDGLAVDADASTRLADPR